MTLSVSRAVVLIGCRFHGLKTMLDNLFEPTFAPGCISLIVLYRIKVNVVIGFKF